MSDITPSPAVVADPNLSGEAANAVDDANNHTPDPVTPPLVERVPDPATPDPSAGLSELTALVGKLAETVASLEGVVIGLVDKDERPHGVPWTHAGMKSHD